MKDFQPYYVAIFSSVKTADLNGYEALDNELFNLVEDQPGYLGAESFRDADGRDVTIVKFRTIEDMQDWKNQPLHLEAQKKGREKWYKYYNVKVCKVEREYEFKK